MRLILPAPHRPRSIVLGTAVALGAVLLSSTAAISQAPPGGVDLGTAAPFVILAATGVTNTGATTLLGDVGSHPNGSFTGDETVTHTGTDHADSEVTRIAKDDLVKAYDTAAGAATTETISADLGGRSLVAGVYTAPSTMSLTGTVTLVGGADDVFIFQAGSSLITGTDSEVALQGVNPCNVYWQVGSSATLGTRTAFVGNILAMSSATLDPGATVDGRVLARDGTVTLINNTVDASMCTTVADGGGNGEDEGTGEGDGDGTGENDGDGTGETGGDGTGENDGDGDGTGEGDGTPTPPIGSDTPTTDTPTTGTPETGTPTSSGTPETGTPTSSGTPETGTPESGIPEGDGTTSQVTAVPLGGVGAGDGSAASNAPTNSQLLMLALLAVITAAATAAVRPRQVA